MKRRSRRLRIAVLGMLALGLLTAGPLLASAAPSFDGRLELERNADVTAYHARIDSGRLSIELLDAREHPLGEITSRFTREGVQVIEIEYDRGFVRIDWDNGLAQVTLGDRVGPMATFRFENGEWKGDRQSWAFLDEMLPRILLAYAVYEDVHEDWQAVGPQFGERLITVDLAYTTAGTSFGAASGSGDCDRTTFGLGLGTRQTQACASARSDLDFTCRNISAESCCWVDPEGCDCGCLFGPFGCGCMIEGRYRSEM